MSRTITFRPGPALSKRLPKRGASEIIRSALIAYFSAKRTTRHKITLVAGKRRIERV